MSFVTLHNHRLAGSYSNGYTVTVEREDRGYRFGNRQYAYYARIRRNNDGTTVRVALQTLQNAKFYGEKGFSTYKFGEWLKTSKVASTPVAVAKVPVAVNKTDIDVEVTKKGKVDISIVLKKEGDAEDLADELRNIISDLEDAIYDLEHN
jgi:hypothetical protein